MTRQEIEQALRRLEKAGLIKVLRDPDGNIITRNGQPLYAPTSLADAIVTGTRDLN